MTLNDTNRVRVLEDRARDLEHTARAMEERLKLGAPTMAEIRDTVAEMRRPPNPWGVAIKVFGVVAVIAGIAFAAGSYPTRGEWQGANQAQQHRTEAVEDRVQELGVEQQRLGGEIKLIKASQDRSEAASKSIEDKLERALRRR